MVLRQGGPRPCSMKQRRRPALPPARLLAPTPWSFLQSHHTHMLLLLKLLTTKQLPTRPATNRRGLHRTAPPLIPELLLFCRPDTLSAAIATGERLVLVVERG